MNEHTIWSYWTLTVTFLAIGLLIWPTALFLAMIVNLAHAIHFLLRQPGIFAFPMQVRICFLSLLVLGQAPFFGWVHWVQLIGGTVKLTTGYCPLARMMSLLPWNRNQPISWGLLNTVIFTPPVSGSIVKIVSPE
ncbi:MAG: hypothetical protein ABFS08_07855 [Pseudomonadota bacterium]